MLRQVLPSSGLVLEVASGTGEHAAFFAPVFPALTWQPTDPEPAHLASVAAWRAWAAVPSLAVPVRLDVEEQPWPVECAEAVVNINMIHIAPWSAAQALLRGAARLLSAGCPLVLYGPFKRAGRHTADSNARFDERLRAEDPRWGVRDLDQVQQEAEIVGMRLDRIEPMPANNLVVVFRRA